MAAGCRMWAAAKRRVFGVPAASRGDGAGPGGVLRVQVGYFVVAELWAVAQKGAEEGIRPLSTDTSLMTWRVA